MASGRVSTNNFAAPDFIVDGSGLYNGATHTTIASAVADASSGDYIFIRTGTYTEDITLTDGINLVGWSVGFNNQPKIVGKVSISSGTANINGLLITTNGNFAVSATSTGTFNVSFCRLDATDNVPIQCTSSSGMRIIDSSINLQTTGIGIHTHSDGTLSYRRCTGGNYGGSTTPATTTGGILTLTDTGGPFAYSLSGSSNLQANGARSDLGPYNTVSLTMSGTSTATINNCRFENGSAASVSIGTGCLANISSLIVDSTNTNPITGSGSLVYSSIEFKNSGQGINVTSTTRRPLAVGSLSFDGNTNKLQNYSEGSWNPTLTGATGNPTVSYTTQSGSYTRIGDTIICRATVVINTLSGGSGDIRISLPFTTANDGLSNTGSWSANGVDYTASVMWVQVVAGPNLAYARLIEQNDAASGNSLDYPGIGTGDSFTFSLTYKV